MNRFPYFSYRQYRAMLVLEVVLILILFGLFLSHAYTHEKENHSLDSTFSKRVSVRASSRTYTYAVEEERVETFPFDPNTADSVVLLRLGLAPWQVQAIYKYRAKHGRYHTPEDFQHLPGMTMELWERLGPMVRIDPKYQYLRPSSDRKTADMPVSEKPVEPFSNGSVPKEIRDTLSRPHKFEEITLVDINTADTLLLQRIPGIASYRARKIVEYRNKLGGYTHVEQVMESCELPDEVLEWFVLSPQPLKRLDVNNLTVRQLMRHPYITFYQAKALVEYRTKHGSLSGLEDFKQIRQFSKDDLERLMPYLLFQ